MKIGIDASRYTHPEATGVEWYSWHIINGILRHANKNDEIILYSKAPLDLKGGENKVIRGERFWTLKHLSKEMKETPPDVLFIPSHVLPLSLPKKSVITIHDVAFRYLRKSYSYLQYQYLNWSTKSAVKRADRIIVPSFATKNDLISLFSCDEEKIEVIHHGFVPPNATDEQTDEVFEKSEVFQYFEISKDMPYVLFVGRLESKKNLSNLIEAFSEFSKSHPNFKLILAGKRGVGFDNLTRKVSKLKIADKVIMPGYVTEVEKAALYKYCKVFAFPSLYEGFGLPILEAFYYEKPVLASEVSCVPEVAGNAAHYIDPNDINGISEGLTKLISDKNYSKELVEKGLEQLKKFDWDEASKKTLKVLHG